MNTTSDRALSLQTSAEALAARNWAANLRALSQTQPTLLRDIESLTAGVEWVFGRDGTLTALERGRWWSGTSVPMAAGRRLLKDLELRGTVGCFLCPTHSAQVRAALDRLKRQQAIVAIVPEVRDVRWMLQCEDFAQDVERHRLYFAWGPDWARHLERLLEDWPGLPVPTQFIRLPLLGEDAAGNVIQRAQEVFSRQTQLRAQRIRDLQSQWRAPTAGRECRACVVAPSTFRLWEQAGRALMEALGSLNTAQRPLEIVHIDPDDPAMASPLGLAMRAGACDMFLAADKGRSDLPDVLPLNLPWITWVTGGQIPAAAGAGPHDSLLLADERWMETARRAGWVEEKACMAGWPRRHLPSTVLPRGELLVLADTHPIRGDEPMDLSSHRLLWESILGELRKDPFALGEDLGGYLNERMGRMNISEEGIDRRKFIEHLIVPAYQQGLARTLMEVGLPLRLAGQGWDQIEEFKAKSIGAVNSPETLLEQVSDAGALVHVWPWLHAHPMDSTGRPVVRRTGRRRESFVREARLALNAPEKHDSNPKLPSLGETLQRLLSIRDQVR